MAQRTRTTHPTPSPKLVSSKQVSTEFGIKYTSLRDLVFRGELPIVKVGRAWYFARADVEHWIASNKRTLVAGVPVGSPPRAAAALDTER